MYGVILFGMCGCSNNKDLENRIKMLENKINTLEEKNNNLLTKEKLVGVWENNVGTITFNEDGSYVISNDTTGLYRAYEIYNDYIVFCYSDTPLKNCTGIYHGGDMMHYIYKDNKILLVSNNGISGGWTRK